MIHQGDVLTVLRGMESESAHCCVTSPPYWGLRSYLRADHPDKPLEIGSERLHDCLGWATGSKCDKCYVCRITAVFSEVRRVLRKDGTLWLNIGDCYANDGKWGGTTGGKHAAGLHGEAVGRLRLVTGLKPKDLCMMPARVAMALQADGWWLRMDNIWSKPNPMPESVTDRTTKAHEYVFLLAKSERYRYDREAIFEPFESTHASGNDFIREHRLSFQNGDGTTRGNDKQWVPPSYNGSSFTRGKTAAAAESIQPVGQGPRKEHAGRNCRSVWHLTSEPTPEAHFATFPVKLAERCILAGCPPGSTVLDPFAGAGTTWLAALKHGRGFVGAELNAEYIEIARQRVERHMPLLAEVSA